MKRMRFQKNDLPVKTVRTEGKLEERKVRYGTGNDGTERKEKSGV